MATRDKLLEMIPPGSAADYILEIAGQAGITALLHTRLGYGHVNVWAASPAGRGDHFDLERDFYPYPSAHFRTIVCEDVLEELSHDPMYMLDEIHRILRPGCDLVLTTRRFTPEQVHWLLENCGMQVVALETTEDSVYGVGRKIGRLRERYPAWLYPGR